MPPVCPSMASRLPNNNAIMASGPSCTPHAQGTIRLVQTGTNGPPSFKTYWKP